MRMYESSYDNVILLSVAPHCDWLSHQRDQLRISQTKTTSSELIILQPFVKSLSQCQTTTVPVASVLCLSWHPSMIPLLCSREKFIAETLQGRRWRLVFVFFARARMCVFWHQGCWCYAATVTQWTAHTTVE